MQSYIQAFFQWQLTTVEGGEANEVVWRGTGSGMNKGQIAISLGFGIGQITPSSNTAMIKEPMVGLELLHKDCVWN